MIFNQLYYLYFIQNKFWVFWHSYVHKCKQGEHHTFVYTSARINITQHSWAQRDFWTTSSTRTGNKNLDNEASASIGSKPSEVAHPVGKRRPAVLMTCLIFTEKDLSISPQVSLPSWQIGVGFKSQSSFLFHKNSMYKNKKTNKHLRSTKQN